ncbi:hypothetical protein M0638_10400 [Roseomonas sp. NAR14]|uniref:Alpha/beta hydrolase n=1 Tax=Roseomonas acroporae TaxID=2937791 RepID=A0A9X1Y7U4_9PROT|nr:hypothetical protein [Roseomonas acroporae]MCK8784793.1 hypothetical protein [Roseomonas acroporae]
MTARPLLAALLGGALLLAGPARAVDEDAPNRRPVRVVAPARLPVATPAGQGVLPLYVSQDWSRPLPGVTRALIVIHGRLRDADVYDATGERAVAASGTGAATLLVTPQFLAGIDVPAHRLPDDTLRWTLEGWQGGDPAEGPAPLSSFDALDAILARLADRALFPALRQVVVAGHSGGGQVVQRYAVLGKGGEALGRAGVALRYVVANPSSYAYFGPERPDGPPGENRGFARPDAAACPGYDRWKYGMQGLPPYAGNAAPAALEAGYVARDVVYLLGTADTNPRHPALDRSCMAEAQGPYRYARGLAYLADLRRRHPEGLRHRLLEVPGVGHDGNAMLTSACGLAALFDRPGCGGP